ncbi:site-2 protease family protein [Patescibacteria group bacterium]|nr:site-2 protease family protein [Patescibacteria group bacterium]
MNPVFLLFYFFIVIPSAIIHEYAHGWMADRLGDPTARYAGRLTLNPKAHIDLWGTILMPMILAAVSGGTFIFAYAKPVPYNPYNLKDQKWGPALVGLAGPLSNLMLALCFALFLRMGIASVNESLAMLFYVIVQINIILLVFNLLPIPPLDGSKVLYALLPDSARNIQLFMERYGLILLFIFIFSCLICYIP